MVTGGGHMPLRPWTVGMVGTMRLSRFVIGAVILTAVECAGLLAIELATIAPAQAQFLRDDRYPFLRRQRTQRSGGFFQDLFGTQNSHRNDRGFEQPYEGGQRTDRAPSPHKVDKSVTPTTSIVVIGDGMADWLAYGLEDAFSDQPEVAIDRQNKYHSGLLRYDTKGDLDWWHVVRDILTKEKANYVVMMLGVSDRENIREKDLAKEAEKQKAETAQTDNKQGDKTAPDQKKSDNPDQPSIAAPEPKPRKVNGVVEFRSEQWATIYSRRLDETITALKSKGVPVFWVGLPSIRGAKSTADAVYLNDLFRARAERAGVNYIDVWDGFVDDAGKYSSYGPDYEGQMRRLRSSDGVYFTKYGARKLAHYVEREIRRYMSNRALPVALPTGPLTPAAPGARKSTVRPVAGPVVPLTVTTGNADQLLGGAGARPAYGDEIAADVLVKGEPVNAPPGRADDFNWQRGATPAVPAPGPEAVAPTVAAPAIARTEPPAAIRQVEPKSGEKTSLQKSAPQTAGKPTQTSASGKLVPPADVGTKTVRHEPTPRRRSSFPFGNPLGWLR
jgi:uncharacterized protein